MLGVIRTRFQALHPDSRLLFGGAAQSFTIQGLAAVCGLLVGVVIARRFGAEVAGIYFLVVMLTRLLGHVSTLGLELAAAKLFARPRRAGAGAFAIDGAAVRKFLFISLGVGALGAVAFVVFARPIGVGVFGSPVLADVLPLAALALFAISGNAIFAALQRACYRVAWEKTLNQLSIRAIVLAAVAVGLPATTEGIIQTYVAATIATALLGLWLSLPLLRLPRAPDGAARATRALLSLSLPLLGVALANNAMDWLTVLLLGIYMDTAAVGIFRAAFQLVWVPAMLLTAMNSIMGPMIAAFRREGAHADLARLCRKATVILVACTAPLIALFVLAPELPLSMFGAEFLVGTTTLQILALGQFVNLATGPVGMLLAMGGRERMLLATAVSEVGAVLVLGHLLIPGHGLEGAAIAVSTTMAARNILTWALASRVMGINTLTGRYTPRLGESRRSAG